MYWLISANSKIYNHAQAFQKWGFIDWRQGNNKYNVGDIIYIYCARPIKQIMYKTVVDKVNLTKENIVNDFEFWYDKNEYYKALDGKFARLRLVEQADKEELKYSYLLKNGLNRAPQGPIKMSDKLQKYVDKYLNDHYDEDFYPDSANADKCIEGARVLVSVNKYERSSIARRKCIEYKGCKCFVCSVDFEERYGEIGKGFIHIHHLIPLNRIKKEYVVDYKNDLIPVCPNCHAMLHRKYKNKYLSPNELKALITKSSK